jgi:cyclic pyranopterin phosphate synthase
MNYSKFKNITNPIYMCKRRFSFTHIDPNNAPCMVYVGEKTKTHRIAHARCFIKFPEHVMEQLCRTTSISDKFVTAKGPVLTTAIIGGVMAAKKTSELIPFCHQVPIDDCKIEITEIAEEPNTLQVDATVRAFYTTGIEMEALVGVTNAALIVYDMCKALSHNIRITDIHLVSKNGGKHSFNREQDL